MAASPIRAVLHFAGKTIEEMKLAFADTIEDYRAWCAERGVEPEKPHSGTLLLRVPQELHRRLAEKAAEVGASLNQFIVRQLEAPDEARVVRKKAVIPKVPAAKRKSQRTKSPHSRSASQKR